MFVTVYDKVKKLDMPCELKPLGCSCELEIIPNTNPQWCVILVARKQDIKP